MLRSVVFVMGIAVAATALADAPRYRFAAGQEMRFGGTKKNWSGDKPTESKSSWRLWVTQANQHKTCDVVVEAEPDGDAKYLWRITIHPDGTIPWNSTMEVLPAWLSVRRLLPMLPNEEELAKSQWAHAEPRTGIRWDYRCERQADSLAISASCRGPLELVSEGTMEFTWTFDMTKGAIIGGGMKGKWANYQERDEESLVPTETIEHEQEAIGAFRDETQRYFQTVQEYRSRFTPHDWAKQVRTAATVGMDELQQQGRALLEGAQKRSTEATVGEYFRKRLEDHDKRGEWMKSSLKEYQPLVDEKSPEWTAPDLDGNPHRLADDLGKVIVLDFWFRKCNYCIRAQPQFEAVIEHFQGKPVEFLGMNVDENIDDAKFAVAKLHTRYPTLQAKKVQEEYGLSGAPIWLVLDQRGIVRSIHVGYSGRLQEELTESIENLLK